MQLNQIPQSDWWGSHRKLNYIGRLICTTKVYTVLVCTQLNNTKKKKTRTTQY